MICNYETAIWQLYDESSKDDQFIPEEIAKDFIKSTIRVLVDLPFFIPILSVHLPVYLICCLYSKYEQHEEVKAQGKVISATLTFPSVYFLLFLWEWYYVYRFTIIGFFFAIIMTLILFWLHVVSIDDRLEAFKQWRGKFQLFDAFLLGRGNWVRKERILEVLKLRQYIHKQLNDTFAECNESIDNDNIKYSSKAIRSRKTNKL